MRQQSIKIFMKRLEGLDLDIEYCTATHRLCKPCRLCSTSGLTKAMCMHNLKPETADDDAPKVSYSGRTLAEVSSFDMDQRRNYVKTEFCDFVICSE